MGNPDPDPGKPKLNCPIKKGKNGKNFMFEEFFVGVEVFLETDCPL